MITKRRTDRRDPRVKIFLAFEGTRTEPQYFEGLIKKEEKEINAEIIPLYRGPGRKYDSNPKKIAEMVCDYVRWMYKGEYSVDLFIEHLLHDASIKTGTDYGGEKFKELKKSITRSPCARDRKNISDPDEALKICRSIIAENIDIPPRPLIRVRDDARFFIIVDRDPGSFKPEQHGHVRDICERNGFELIVSNPCFEIWLLLHFDIDKKDILEHISSGSELKGLLEKTNGQRHGHLDFGIYHENVGRARMRLKNDGYCEELEELLSENDSGSGTADSIGTNIGMLIDIIFKQRYRSE